MGGGGTRGGAQLTSAPCFHDLMAVNQGQSAMCWGAALLSASAGALADEMQPSS